MFQSIKVIALIAAVTAGVVTAYEFPLASGPAAAVVAGSKFQDRIAPSEGAVSAASASLQQVTYAPPQSNSAGAAIGAPGRGDRLAVAKNCAAQAWPNISPDCVVAADGNPARRTVRLITTEQRDAANTSVLVRLPSSDVAAR